MFMMDIQKSLTEYYHKRFPSKRNPSISQVDDITSGWEAQLIKFNIDFQEDNHYHNEELVARIFQGDQAAEKAVREFNILTRLYDLDFPVPKVYFMEKDVEVLGGPFIIMEFIKGKELATVLGEASKNEYKDLMDEFTRIWVSLHRLDASKIYPDVQQGTTEAYLDGLFMMVDNLLNNLDIAWFDPVIGWLKFKRDSVSSMPLSVIHLDYHTRNVMVRDDGRLVVLDWTLAEYADYRVDLAWTSLILSLYGAISMKDEIIQRYEKESDKETLNIEYFDVIVYTRRLLSMIVSLKMGAEQLGMRSGVEEMMKEDSKQMSTVYNLLKETTGIRLPEIEQAMKSII